MHALDDAALPKITMQTTAHINDLTAHQSLAQAKATSMSLFPSLTAVAVATLARAGQTAD
jgi:hypothetical protein